MKQITIEKDLFEERLIQMFAWKTKVHITSEDIMELLESCIVEKGFSYDHIDKAYNLWGMAHDMLKTETFKKNWHFRSGVG